MLIIKPIQTKGEQAEACARCGVEFHEESMAYSAYVDDVFTGVCQFSLNDERGLIEALAPAEGVDDFEALFIMGRQTMNFIDLCHVHIAEISPLAASERLITALGFQKNAEGIYRLDMTGFFSGGACTSKKNDNASKDIDG